MRVLIVVNSRSGGGDAGLYDFIRSLGLSGAEVVLRFADRERRIEDLLGDVAEFDRVVAAGGDGTASAVCYATRDTGIPVLVYPAGTANLLSSTLGLPLDAQALAEVVVDGVPIRFDIGELERFDENGSPVLSGFANFAGAGYDAAIMESAQSLKATFGAGAYLIAAIANMAPTAARFELVLDGERVSTEGIAVLLINFGRIQFDLPVTHGSDPCDGRFEVAVVRTKNVVGLLPAVAAAMLDLVGDHADRSPSLDVYSANTVSVEASPSLRMQYDGEVMDASTPFTARVLPGAATLLVPSDSTYANREVCSEG